MKKFNIGLLVGLLIGLLVGTVSFAVADSPVKLIVNGKTIACDTPPQVINGRVMVPARFIAEPLGASVTWDSANNAVVVNGAGYVATTAIKTVVPSALSDFDTCKGFMSRLSELSNALDLLDDPNVTISVIESKSSEVQQFLNEVDQWNASLDYKQIQIHLYQLIKNTNLALIEKGKILKGETNEDEGISNISRYIRNFDEYVDTLNVDKKVLINKGLVQ